MKPSITIPRRQLDTIRAHRRLHLLGHCFICPFLSVYGGAPVEPREPINFSFASLDHSPTTESTVPVSSGFGTSIIIKGTGKFLVSVSLAVSNSRTLGVIFWHLYRSPNPMPENGELITNETLLWVAQGISPAPSATVPAGISDYVDDTILDGYSPGMTVYYFIGFYVPDGTGALSTGTLTVTEIA